MTSSRFWQERRVLVTGHTGFKGSWLTVKLRLLGAQVLGYALSASSPSMYELARVGDEITSIDGDVRDLAKLVSVFAEFAPEVVFHLAAQPLVSESYKDPVSTYATNVMGTVHVLEACRSTSSVRSIVIVTSDKCYRNTGSVHGYCETDELGGDDPYSNSKACAELVAAAYRSSFFNFAPPAKSVAAVATVRAGNVIGGGDWGRDRLVPDLLASFLAGETAVIRKPRAVRPWQHVLDPLNGYLLLAERLYGQGPAYDGAWNFGPPVTHLKPVSWVADTLAELWPGQASWRCDTKPSFREADVLSVNSSKAQEHLQWKPKLDLLSTLRWTVEWTHALHNGSDVRAITEQQIATHDALLELGGTPS